MSIVTFYGPVFGGALLLLFFLAPFFLSRPQKQTTYRIDTNENPALAALVQAVASHVGAPAPTRISASLDSSIRVEKNEDNQVEVVLGLPLIAVQTARQTSGFLAHEFYKFSSRPSAKTWGLTNVVRGLFARSAYECGDAEQEVVEWGGSRRIPAGVTYGFLPWMFDQFIAVSCQDLTENMILDADRSQTRVAGSSSFAMSQLDKRLLEELAIMSQDGFAAAREVGQKSENLPAFYANKLKILKTEQPEYVKRICQDLMEPQGETEPCMANRIAVAQSYKDEGIFPADKPSAGLFKDFTRLCRSTTALHYDRHFGSEIEQTKARLAEQAARKAAEKVAAEARAKAEAEAAIVAENHRSQAQKSDYQAAQDAAAQFAAQQEAAERLQRAAPHVPQVSPQQAGTVRSPNERPSIAPVNSEMATAQVSPPAPVDAQPPVTPPIVTPTVAPEPITQQEQQPAVPAVAAVPTVPSSVPGETWTDDQKIESSTISPRPVSVPSTENPMPTPAEQVPPPTNVPESTAPNRNYLAAFLQTETLTNSQELFLPIDEAAAAADPELVARQLLAARQRYEQVYVARKPELSQIASGQLRLRSLQMARTISLVGLPIDAEVLGLPEATNLAAATACDHEVQLLDGLHDQIQELIDQATLRFVSAIQLAETKVVAQSIGFQPSEIQSVRLAVSYLTQHRNLATTIRELGRLQRQLRCLLFNLNGNEHLEELTTSLSLTSFELAETMRQLQTILPTMSPYSAVFRIELPTFAEPDHENSQALVDDAAKMMAVFEELYRRSFVTLARVAERIEQHFGQPPLPELRKT